MTLNNHCSLLIELNNNQLNCSIVDKQNNQFVIKLKHQQFDYLPVTILFDMNKIIVGKHQWEI